MPLWEKSWMWVDRFLEGETISTRKTVRSKLHSRKIRVLVAKPGLV
jgi:hypothetical protein